MKFPTAIQLNNEQSSFLDAHGSQVSTNSCRVMKHVHEASAAGQRDLGDPGE